MVFGMWIVFLLVIVVIFVWINFFVVMYFVFVDLDEYLWIIGYVYGLILVFGGIFLMMVVFKFFIDEDKLVDWVKSVEC